MNPNRRRPSASPVCIITLWVLVLVPVSLSTAAAQSFYEAASVEELIESGKNYDKFDDDSVDDFVYHLVRVSDTLEESVGKILEVSALAEYRDMFSEAIEHRAARMLAAGDIAAAFDAFLGASSSATPGRRSDRLALRAAATAIEMGESRKALEIAAEIEGRSEDETVRERASVIGIRALSHERGAEAAIERMERLEPRTPLGLYQWFLLSGDETISERLGEEFGDSIVAAVSAGSVRRLLLPSSLLAPWDAVNGLGVPTARGSSDREASHGGSVSARSEDDEAQRDVSGEAGDRVAGVQLGSFRSSEYAHAQRDNLVDHGYEAVVREDDDGSHKVVIVFDELRERSEAEQLLLRLRDEGFEGFVRTSF